MSAIESGDVITYRWPCCPMCGKLVMSMNWHNTTQDIGSMAPDDMVRMTVQCHGQSFGLEVPKHKLIIGHEKGGPGAPV